MASEPGAMSRLQSDNPVGGAQRESRESWRKKKELEEARKAGTAPAEVDEEGRYAIECYSILKYTHH